MHHPRATVRCEINGFASSLLLALGLVVVGAAPTLAAPAPTSRVHVDPHTGEVLTHTSVCTAGRFRCAAQSVARDGVTAHVAQTGFGAQVVQSMYAVDPTRGAGLTIAIVDAYGYPNLESDLATYRSNYGLPACTTASGCLTIVNDQGKATPIPAQGPTGADDWTIEIALDVDMVSAVCPLCKIIVLLSDVDADNNAMLEAQNSAITLGAVAISNSWSGPEYTGVEADAESYFDHPGIGQFACTGDYGYDMEGDAQLKGPQFPATSLHVVGVGGTSVVQSTNTRGWAETAWTSAGSSCSTHFAKPAYQGSDSGCAFRAASDVSAIADPDTAVAIYNASNGGWIEEGGTSVATPVTTALMAAAGHADLTPDWIYAHASIFHDVTSGKNGTCGTKVCDATTGWDGPTGIGTPDQDKIAAISGSGGRGDGSGSSAPDGSGSSALAVAITSPADGATVAPGFSIDVTADGAASVDITMNGTDLGTLTSAPFSMTAPQTLASGTYTLAVTASDSEGNTATSQISITVGAAGGANGEDYNVVGGCAAGGGLGGGGLLVLGVLLGLTRKARRRR